MLKRLVITDAHDWVLPADGACRCGTTRDSSAVSGGAATERGGAGGVSADGDAAAAPGSGDSSCSRTSGTAPRELRLVGGVDISFDKADPDDACAALVVVELPSLEVVYERYARVRMRLPYISGFLAFREMELLLPLLREAREEHPDRFPDVILVDGSGVLHPRGLGLASHLGVVADVPTIGIAKKFLHVDGLTKDRARAAAAVNKAAGDAALLVGDSGRVWGAALKSTDDAVNPVFVSVGHRLSLDTALAVVRATTRFRVPEPVRQADLRSRSYLRDLSAARASATTK